MEKFRELLFLFSNLVVMSYFYFKIRLNKTQIYIMKKTFFYFCAVLFSVLLLSSCKSKLLGYDDAISLSIEKKCTLASVYDSTNKQTFTYTYDNEKRPMKAVSSNSTEINTFEYDGKGRWAKYLQENTDSASYLFSFIYNDTTNLIKVVNQFDYGYYGFYLNSYLEYFYDSLGRATKVNRYVNSEGWYLQATYRLEYDKKGNVIKQFIKTGFNAEGEYLQIEYTGYDDKINFASLNHNYQLMDPLGVNNHAFNGINNFIPNFSKNNVTSANYFSSYYSKSPEIKFTYKYNYDSNGLPIKISGQRVYDAYGYAAVYNYSNNLQYNCGH